MRPRALYYVGVSPYRGERDYGLLVSAASQEAALREVSGFLEGCGRVKDARLICETQDAVFTEV
jgi:hypothetical protein